MRTRDRKREEQQRPQDAGDSGSSGNDNPSGDELRNRARRLLELGDDAINEALSQNSERFLQQNRQQGGE